MILFAAAGYVAGVLMAPRKGSKTRNKLQKDANKRLAKFEKMSEAKINEGQKMYRDGVSKLVDTGDQLLKSAKETIAAK